MKHFLVLIILVSTTYCDVAHLQYYPAAPIVQYNHPLNHQAYYTTPFQAQVVNPYVGAYHNVPAYSRQVRCNSTIIVYVLLSLMKN